MTRPRPHLDNILTEFLGTERKPTTMGYSDFARAVAKRLLEEKTEAQRNHLADRVAMLNPRILDEDEKAARAALMYTFYVSGMTNSDVGRRFGITGTRVSQLWTEYGLPSRPIQGSGAWIELRDQAIKRQNNALSLSQLADERPPQT